VDAFALPGCHVFHLKKSIGVEGLFEVSTRFASLYLIHL